MKPSLYKKVVDLGWDGLDSSEQKEVLEYKRSLPKDQKDIFTKAVNLGWDELDSSEQKKLVSIRDKVKSDSIEAATQEPVQRKGLEAVDKTFRNPISNLYRKSREFLLPETYSLEQAGQDVPLSTRLNELASMIPAYSIARGIKEGFSDRTPEQLYYDSKFNEAMFPRVSANPDLNPFDVLKDLASLPGRSAWALPQIGWDVARGNDIRDDYFTDQPGYESTPLSIAHGAVTDPWNVILPGAGKALGFAAKLPKVAPFVEKAILSRPIQKVEEVLETIRKWKPFISKATGQETLPTKAVEALKDIGKSGLIGAGVGALDRYTESGTGILDALDAAVYGAGGGMAFGAGSKAIGGIGNRIAKNYDNYASIGKNIEKLLPFYQDMVTRERFGSERGYLTEKDMKEVAEQAVRIYSRLTPEQKKSASGLEIYKNLIDAKKAELSEIYEQGTSNAEFLNQYGSIPPMFDPEAPRFASSRDILGQIALDISKKFGADKTPSIMEQKVFPQFSSFSPETITALHKGDQGYLSNLNPNEKQLLEDFLRTNPEDKKVLDVVFNDLSIPVMRAYEKASRGKKLENYLIQPDSFSPSLYPLVQSGLRSILKIKGPEELRTQEAINNIAAARLGEVMRTPCTFAMLNPTVGRVSHLNFQDESLLGFSDVTNVDPTTGTFEYDLTKGLLENATNDKIKFNPETNEVLQYGDIVNPDTDKEYAKILTWLDALQEYKERRTPTREDIQNNNIFTKLAATFFGDPVNKKQYVGDVNMDNYKTGLQLALAHQDSPFGKLARTASDVLSTLPTSVMGSTALQPEEPKQITPKPAKPTRFEGFKTIDPVTELDQLFQAKSKEGKLTQGWTPRYVDSLKHASAAAIKAGIDELRRMK